MSDAALAHHVHASPAVPQGMAGSRLRTNAAAAMVAFLAMANFMVGPGRPVGMVWDEGYYLTSTRRYEDGRAQFGTHPPLGPMLLAAGDALLGRNAALDTSHLGDAKHAGSGALPAGYSFSGMRLASGIAATLTALAFFSLALRLTGSLFAALPAANLFVFDNALVAHLRAAHLDGFQLLFVVLALWALASVVLRPRHTGWREATIGGAGAMAMLVKLNAAWLLVPAAMLVLWRAWQHRAVGWLRAVVAATAAAARMLVAGILAVLLVLTAHVIAGREMPDAATPAGRQDSAFVSGAYRQYLLHEVPLSPRVLIDAARDSARFIAADIDGLGLHDDNGSAPWQWLVQRQPISYRWDSDGMRTSYVQLVPNPLGWALASLAPLAATWMLWLQWHSPAPGGRASRPFLAVALLSAWTACFALHEWIAAQRVMYLYHAFNGLLLGYLLALLAWSAAIERWPALRRRQAVLAGAFMALHLAAFLWLSPLSFHRPLTRDACERRNFPLRVVECRP